MKSKIVSQQKTDSETADERLQALLQQLLSQRNVKHAILAVERGDRSFRWIGTVGEADPEGTPMRADTPFFIASVTKLYIAAVIMKLHEQSLISLDSPISTYLPQPLIAGTHRLNGTDFTDRITIQHLLNHTSGLADWLEDSPKDGQTIIEQLVKEGDRAFDIEEITQIVRERLSPHFPPQQLNTKHPSARYSDTNFQLLIAIIEAVTAQPLQQVFERELFLPLNLQQTFQAGYPSLAAKIKFATLWADDKPLNLPLALRSIGDLYSTAADLMIFMRALTRGEVFEDPKTFSLMQRRWLRFGFPLDRAALRAPGWPVEYGLGLMRFHLPRLFTFPYKMPAVIGHTGSTGSWLFYCPELDVHICGAVDQVSAGAVPYHFIPGLLKVFAALNL
jgi:CubicO group peptidase (beta-lactamase class C family)